MGYIRNLIIDLMDGKINANELAIKLKKTNVSRPTIYRLLSENKPISTDKADTIIEFLKEYDKKEK